MGERERTNEDRNRERVRKITSVPGSVPWRWLFFNNIYVVS
jgi:hypothetical protein